MFAFWYCTVFFCEPAEQYTKVNLILTETIACAEVRILLLDESSFYQLLMSLSCISPAVTRGVVCGLAWFNTLATVMLLVQHFL